MHPYSRWVDARILATFCLVQIRHYDGQVHLRLLRGPPGPPKEEKVLGSSGVHYPLNLRSDVLAGTTLLLVIGRFHNEDCAACCGAFRPLVQNYFAHIFSLCQILLVD